MSLRATRQYISTLAAHDGKARVSRQYITILSKILTELDVSASNELDFEQAASPGVYERSGSNSIAFTQAARPGLIKASASNIIAIEYIESIIGPVELNVSNTIAFEGTGRLAETFEITVESPITFVNTVVASGKLRYSLSNTLTINQISDLTVKIRDADNEIDFESVASVSRVKYLESTIDFEQDAVKGLHLESINHQLELVQTPRLNPITIGPSNYDIVSLPAQTIDFTSEVRNSEKSIDVLTELDLSVNLNVIQPWTLEAESILQTSEEETNPENGDVTTVITGLQDSVQVELVPHRNVTTPVWLSQNAKKVLYKVGATSLSVDNELAFTSVVPTIIYLDAENQLDFIDSADIRHEFPSTQLDIVSQVSRNLITSRLASTELEIISSFIGVPGSPDLCNYSPIVGSTTQPDAPQNRLKNVPTIDSSRHGVTLFYPWVSPTTTIDLRGPDLGNRNRLEFQRINRETRGGTLKVWADPMWPKNERLVLGFSGLTELEGQNLLDFILLTLGKEIGLTDWEGNTWKVVTMTPDEPLVRNSRENLSINLDFEITQSTLRGRNDSALVIEDSVDLFLDRTYMPESFAWITQSANRQAQSNKNIDYELELATDSDVLLNGSPV